MVDEIETALAKKLRAIAEQVKIWEQRDADEAIALGTDFSRKLFWHDLEKIASMFEGGHRHYKLRAGKPTGGRRGRNPEHVQRDLKIVARIKAHIENGLLTGEAKGKAATELGCSDKTADAAWQRYRDIEGNPALEYFHQLEATGAIKITKVERGDS